MTQSVDAQCLDVSRSFLDLDDGTIVEIRDSELTRSTDVRELIARQRHEKKVSIAVSRSVEVNT